MKKDKEWLKEKVEAYFSSWWSDPNVYIRDLMDNVKHLINQLDEPEKVVVPKFVADWIEETKKNDRTLVFAICHIYDENELGESPTEKENRIYQWMESNDNEEVFARAWLGGYEVEKEQKILRFGP